MDTGPLVALLNRADGWHEWAEQAFGTIDEPFWTSEAVITEAAWNLGENSPAARELLAAVHDGVICIRPVIADGAARLAELMAKYERMDVCDGSLVVLSERFPRARILTVDFFARFPCLSSIWTRPASVAHAGAVALRLWLGSCCFSKSDSRVMTTECAFTACRAVTGRRALRHDGAFPPTGALFAS